MQADARVGRMRGLCVCIVRLVAETLLGGRGRSVLGLWFRSGEGLALRVVIDDGLVNSRG